MIATSQIEPRWNRKHKEYMVNSVNCEINVAEGAVRSGKTVDNTTMAARFIECCPDKIHVATGSTLGNAKLNIGDCNGFGLEYIFRGRCKWGKYKDNDALKIHSKTGLKIVIFAGGSKADSFKRIRGNSYGLWIATEINLHHPEMIREIFNRQLAAKERKVFWDLNPDRPNHWIYTNYIDKYKTISAEIGGYNYQHFTIYDNINVTSERLRSTEAQYEIGSVWYNRDILGKRVGAEGIIYPNFAANPKAYHIEYDDINLEDIESINIGVDFGGNKSGLAFVAVAALKESAGFIVLKSFRKEGKNISVELMLSMLESFIHEIQQTYSYYNINKFLKYIPTHIIPDNAESYMINSVANVVMRLNSQYGYIMQVNPSYKDRIINRIRLTDHLFVTRKIHFTEDSVSLIDALCEAIWNDKPSAKDNERLDDFSTDIDSIDAFEYTIERYMERFLQAHEYKSKLHHKGDDDIWKE